MKGVILGINPAVTLIDITHEIPPGDIRAAAFALAASCSFFPKGTVHVVVVDPGVGSDRKAIVVKTKRFHFVAPDNGVLSWAVKREPIIAVHELRNPNFFLRSVSRTFHGRDVFAPAAAHLSRRLPAGKLGPAVADIIRLPWTEAVRVGDRRYQGQVIYVDRFGNGITNIESSSLESLEHARNLEVWRGTKRLCNVAEFYNAVPLGQPVAVFGSSGFLEIAVNGGNASAKLRLQVGSRIELRFR